MSFTIGHAPFTIGHSCFIQKKSCSRAISRVLYLCYHRCLSLIYTLCHHNALSFHPPTGHSLGQATLSRWYTRTFSSRCAQPVCHHTAGQLLPNLLTLTSNHSQRRLFSSTLINPHGFLPIKKRDALCCSDFPLVSVRYKRQTALLQLL